MFTTQEMCSQQLSWNGAIPDGTGPMAQSFGSFWEQLEILFYQIPDLMWQNEPRWFATGLRIPNARNPVVGTTIPSHSDDRVAVPLHSGKRPLVFSSVVDDLKVLY